MACKSKIIALLVLLFLFHGMTYAGLAKLAVAANDASVSTTDYSGYSQYAHGSDCIVNLLTGTASYQMSLYTVTSKSGLSYTVNLTYCGAEAAGAASENNTVAPTGLVGLGWNMVTDAIIVDSKNTATITDDEYFFKEQNGSVCQIIRTGTTYDTYVYQIKDRPYWKLVASYTGPTSSGWRAIHGWTVTLPDGLQYRYGGVGSSAARYVTVDVNGTFNPTAKGNAFYYQWDLESIVDINGGKISLKYTQVAIPWDLNMVEVEDGQTHPFLVDWDWGNILKGFECARVLEGAAGWYVLASLKEDENSWDEESGGTPFGGGDTYYVKHGVANPSETGCITKAMLPPDWRGLSKWDVINSLKSYWWVKRIWIKTWWFWPIPGLFGPEYNLCLTSNHRVYTAGLNVISSVLTEISSDRGDKITLGWGNKSNFELGTRNLHEDAKFINAVTLSKGDRTETLMFKYSGSQDQGGVANEIPHMNAGTTNEKRLLMGIYSASGTGATDRIFEYNTTGLAKGCLTRITEPMTGKRISLRYHLNEVRDKDGKCYGVNVVDRLIHSGGVATIPDIVETFSYTSDPAEQHYDKGSNIAYWGKVTAQSANGSVVTAFEVNSSDFQFGTCKSKEQYSTASKLVSSEVFEYAQQSFGTTGNEWHKPLLKKVTKTIDGVSTTGGTLVTDAAIDDNNGMSDQSWTTGNDGKTLVTKRSFAYIANPAMGTGTTGKNMFVQEAASTVLQVADYNETTGDISAGKVVKAAYTKWFTVATPGVTTSIWRPAAKYAWNVSADGVGGVPTATFVNFPPSNPTANNWQLTGTIDVYDPYGNAIQVSNASGIPVTTVMGGQAWLPIGTVANASFYECGIFPGDYDLAEPGTDNTWYFDKFNGWEKGTSGSVLASLSTTTAHFGQKSTRILNGGGRIARNFKVRGNTTYELSVWTKVVSGSLNITAELRSGSSTVTVWPVINSSIPTIVNTQSVSQGISTTWVRVPLTVAVPAGDGNYVRVNVGGSATSDAYIDEVRFAPVGSQVSSTYYDSKWRLPTMAVDANNNPGARIVYDDYGQAIEWGKIDKTKSRSDIGYAKIYQKKEYHLMGDDLRVVAPNGGEVIPVGSLYTINWTLGKAEIGSNGVNIEFFDYESWIPIVSQLKNAKTYNWIIPTTLRNNKHGLIRVTAVDHPLITDQSDKAFSTVGDFLSVITPEPGADWHGIARLQHEIKWVTAGGTTSAVKIEYSNGVNWKTIVNSAPNAGSYVWTLSKDDNTTRACKIRISTVGTSPIITKESPDVFWLKPYRGFIRKFYTKAIKKKHETYFQGGL